jgi:adenylate cyclase
MRRLPRLPRPDAIRLALACALLGFAAGAGVQYAPMWRMLEFRVFDLFSVWSAREQQQPITIVGIDDATATQLNLRWPFPRSMHAQLVDRLWEAGAAVIAFDVQFSEPSTPEDDTRFAQSIKAAGNVVLGSKYDFYETAAARVFQRMDPLIEFTEAGASVGWTDMNLVGDQVPRLMAVEEHSMWRAAIRKLIEVVPDSGLTEPGAPAGAMIRYYLPRDPNHRDPTQTFAYLSYHEVIAGIPDLPDLVGGAIVMVGRAGGASADINAAQADAFPTPFTLTTNKLTPGVVIHATQLENSLNADMLEPATRTQNLLLLGAAIVLLLPFLAWWRPLVSTLGALAVLGATAGAAFWIFRSQHIWLYTASPLAALALAFVANGTGSFVIERRRAGQIRGAFAMYVSNEVVEQMIAHPELLKLGGERREISVLFSDLAGFTSLSEKLTPDAVGQVVNTYLNAMTQVVMKNGGTVDKFIGDAVMAFWGAPLDDPDHALHAVQSAIEMQQQMDALQPQFAALGVDNLALRIGINSGPAIVGNMGSDLRFDYTAIGDTVNLASRLEGANKAYGTPILAAASTVNQVKQQVPMRQVDRVRVKGKKEPVDVFTPCADARLIAMTELAWQTYLDRDWSGAILRIHLLREFAPDDALAAMLEQRVIECDLHPPGEEWDGSVQLEKL